MSSITTAGSWHQTLGTTTDPWLTSGGTYTDTTNLVNGYYKMNVPEGNYIIFIEKGSPIFRHKRTAQVAAKVAGCRVLCIDKDGNLTIE